MFRALGRVVTRLPWLVIGFWVVAAVVVQLVAPPLKSTNDQSEFLPSKYESIQASKVQAKSFPKQSQPGAILVFDRTDGKALGAADTAKVTQIVGKLNTEMPQQFTQAVVTPPSKNKLVQIAPIGLAKSATGYDKPSMDAAKKLRSEVKDLIKGTGLHVGATGTAPQSLDSQNSGNRAQAIVAGATVLLIIVLMALIFRSVIICLLPVLAVGVAISPIAIGLVSIANKAFDLKADNSITVILIVVLYGIGTDYILFLLFRYRERLRLGEDKKTAMVNAMARAGEAIASAGGAVIVSFMALVLSSLGIFRSIGPSLAIAVAVTLAAALTLIPAVMVVLGKALFWPSKKWREEPKAARFEAVGNRLGARPVVYAGAAGLVLALLAILAFGFNPSFDFNSSLPKGEESTVALKTLEKGYPPGATDPTSVVLTSDKPLDKAALAVYAQKLGNAQGIAQVSPQPQLSPDQKTAVFSAFLTHPPGSDASMNAMKGPIRQTAHQAAPPGSTAYVGGTTSVFVDLNKAMARDYSVVFPVAAVIIMVILALLLRSLVAPVYLMVSVGLGFGATLGATVLVFQHLSGDAGLIFMLPIYIYLFVVALGTDYNILMIARLREEARAGKEPKAAAAEAVKHAGPTIAAAGVILAGTFASLMLSGNSLMTSMGFALSFGIFAAAFVMAMFFTPALTALIGHAAWWPGHGDESPASGGDDEPEPVAVGAE